MMHAKRRLRRVLLARRATLTASERQHKSAAIAAMVCALPTFQSSPTIMVYMAQPHEVQTVDIITEARRQGKRIVIPMINGESLMSVELPQTMAQLRRGPYGILEPCGAALIRVAPEEILFATVPGLAFDDQGGRLGFGKGYYDRFLTLLSESAFFCGLAFGLQIVPWVPRQAHDVEMHGIVTEQGLIFDTGHPACEADHTVGLAGCKGDYIEST